MIQYRYYLGICLPVLAPGLWVAIFPSSLGFGWSLPFHSHILPTPRRQVMIPVVEAWCRQNNHHVSRFMMPLSYAAILGGMCTIIGTSTNLIARGLAQQEVPKLRLPFLEIGANRVCVCVYESVCVIVLHTSWGRTLDRRCCPACEERLSKQPPKRGRCANGVF